MEIVSKKDVNFKCKCGNVAVGTIYGLVGDDYEPIEICEGHAQNCIEMGIDVHMY